MKITLLLLLISTALSAQQPLTSLPYTPSLDVTSMDRAIDPCNDFYQYSCGNWVKRNPIPADQSRWDVYAKLTDDNERYLWGLLEQASAPGANHTAASQKTGSYFKACMDERAIENAGAAPLKKLLDEISALRSVSEIPAVLGHIHMEASGGDAMFGFGANQDFANSSRIIAFAAAGGLGFPDRDYYLKDDTKSQETRARYLIHVRNVFQLLGDSAAIAKTEAATVMEIETALAKSSLTRVEKRDPHNLFHTFTRAQLTALTPSFRWAGYLAVIGQPALQQFNVTEPAFFKELDAQLKVRSLSEWKTYLRWHISHDKAQYLSAPFVQEYFEFYSKHLRGIEQLRPRWKRCVQYVDRDLGEALGQVFVQKTFGPDVKARAVAMTRAIQKAMEIDIKQLAWMGDDTKTQALLKLHGMVDKIGYPGQWRDYSLLKIDPADFAGNVGRAAAFESRRQLTKIGKPVNRGEWQMTPPTVNAYYDPQMNDINFPAGVLQPPLFDSKLDDAPNYGDTGATIGHELTHGFDDEGRQFDAKGNLRDWWTSKDAAEFTKRATCISDQYSQYTVIDDIKINSKLTLGEDVADLGGTILAYMAWKNSTSDQQLKPLDELTPDQRFFVGMAQWACGSERPEQKRVNAITNPHSPNEYRINGVVSNLPEFATAFACKAGQPMVRERVCRVW